MTTQYPDTVEPIDGIEPELAAAILGDESDLEPEQHPSAASAESEPVGVAGNDSADATADANAAAADVDNPIAQYLQALQTTAPAAEGESAGDTGSSPADIQDAVRQAVADAMQQSQSQQAQPPTQSQGPPQEQQAKPEEMQALRDAQVAMIDATRPLFEDEATYNNFREMALRGEVTQDAMNRWQATARERSQAQRNANVAENVEDLNRKVNTMMAMQAAAIRQQQAVANGTATAVSGAPLVDPKKGIGLGALLDARAMSEAMGVPFDPNNETARNFMLQGITPNMDENQARAVILGKVQQIAQAQAQQASGQPTQQQVAANASATQAAALAQIQAQAQQAAPVPVPVPAMAGAGGLPPNTANLGAGGTSTVVDADALTDAVLDPNGMSDALWEYVVANSSSLLADDL